MATISVKVAAGADDGFDNNGAWDNTFASVIVGNQSSLIRNAAFRFPSTTISQGGTISTATVTLYGYQGTSGNVNMLLYFADEDASAQIASVADYNGRSLTGSVAWNRTGGIGFGTAYTSPELSSILQTVVDRAGFSGGAVQLIIKENSSSTNQTNEFCSYNYGNSNYYATLNATYTTGGTGQPSAKRFGGVPFTAQGGNVLGTVRRW